MYEQIMNGTEVYQTVNNIIITPSAIKYIIIYHCLFFRYNSLNYNQDGLVKMLILFFFVIHKK